MHRRHDYLWGLVMDAEELEDSDEENEDTWPRILSEIRENLVEEVDLDDLGLYSGDLQDLAEALQRNRSVRRLWLRGTLRMDCSNAFVQALEPILRASDIADLNLSRNCLNNAALTILMASLRGSSVRRLHLSDDDLGDVEAMTLARSMKDLSITSFILRNNKIREDGAAALAAASAGSLDLSSNWMGDAIVKGLASALNVSPLVELVLQSNRISDNGVKVLAIALKDASLKSLDLSRNHIADEGAKALSLGICGSSIVYLNLSHNGIGTEGAKAIATTLRDSNTESLDLSRNRRIGTEVLSAFLEGVQETAVTSLQLLRSRTPETLQIWEEITAALEANRTRTFLLQMEVGGDETQWTFTFRTMAGNVAAVLNWSTDRLATGLLEAVFRNMQASGFQLPSRHLRAGNLRILRPDGGLLDVGEYADDLWCQLVERRDEGYTS